MWRRAEAMRDRIMFGMGTDEPWIMEEHTAMLGMGARAVHWRKPLRPDEIAQMGQTPDVRAREGRA